jgi:serine/threonine protein kinase
MEQVELNRYELGGVLGSGADYEVRAAVDRETGQQVVLKRPQPQMVRRRLHAGIEKRTDRSLQAHHEVGHSIPLVVPILGYTERTAHDEYFGESLEQEYRVTVEERAQGIPLVGDPMARITGVPVGAGQNLFALFPLVTPGGQSAFPIQRQLLDVEERFYQAGYILLDLRPQNIFYQPGSGSITVVDCGALMEIEGRPDSDGNTPGDSPPDIHDFYLEILKFYTTSQPPPTEAKGYREPHGLRPAVRFEQELDQMSRDFGGTPEHLRAAALPMIEKIRNRSYADFLGFRRDLTTYLETCKERNRLLPNLGEACQAWAEALDWLRGEYWQRYLFNPEAELSAFTRT